MNASTPSLYRHDEDCFYILIGDHEQDRPRIPLSTLYK